MSLNLICLHGFLGHGSDYDFLEEQDDLTVQKVNLDSLVHLSPEEIYKELDQYLIPNKENMIIGYSFGARLGIGYFLSRESKLSKLILFAGHAGLKTDAEKESRLPFELQMMSKLESMNKESFLNMWNQYDIFKADKDILPVSLETKIAQMYFENYGLSKQPYYLDELKSFKERVFWHYGSEDTKYCDYAKESLSDFNVTYFKGLGHRLLQHPEIIKQRLREILL